MVFSLQYWLHHIHPVDRELVEAALEVFLKRDEDNYEHWHRLLHCDGTARSVVSRAIVVERQDGQPTRIIGAEIDVTGRPERSAIINVDEQRKKSGPTV
jgi:PAS domain-containing protein